MKISIITTLLVVFLAIATQINAQENSIKLTINNENELTATLVNNSSAEALVELIKNSPLTIEMSDYGNMEKVGPIGTALPPNDEQITTEPGDLILYQGTALVIYYAPNSWNFTRLGKIDDITQDELKLILGTGNVTVTLELASTDTVTSTDTNTVSIENYKDVFSVYPNPVKHNLEVSGTFKSLTLIDIKGCTVMTSKNNIMDVSAIKPGIYFLKIESKNNETITKKIFKI